MERIISGKWAAAVGLACWMICAAPMQTFSETAQNGKETKEPSSLTAQAAVMMDGDSGRILYGKNEDQVLPMASTTKIMTCIVALEYGDPDAAVTVSEYAASMPDVQLNILPGETYRLQDLLYSLMLESHNDSAIAIAEHVAGSREAFADMMNRKARDIGCVNTNFITPNGLDAVDPDTGEIHGTTAGELAMIMRYCIVLSPKREEFLEISRTPSCTFSNLERTRSFSCVNHNTLLTSMDGAISGKTGFTSKAGYCYVGAVERGEKTFICALLACGWPPHKTFKWQDMSKLISYGDQQYDYYELLLEPVELPELPVENGVRETVALKLAEMEAEKVCILMRSDEPAVRKYKIAKCLQAPIPEGAGVGQIEYYVGKSIVSCIPVVTADSVDEWNMEFCLKTLLNRFLFCYNAEKEYC